MKQLISLLLVTFMIISCKDQISSTSNSNPSTSRSKMIIDLSHDYSEETVYWVTAKEFSLDTVFAGMTEKGYYYSAFNFCTAEHGGTHIDAPIHFVENAPSVDEIPLERLIGHAIKVDVSENAANNPDYLVSIDDLKSWETIHAKEIPEGSIVLIETGFAEYYPNRVKYLGTNERGEQAVKKLHFPGLDPEAATWLVENRNIHAIGIDTPSIDYGQSETFDSHVILLGDDIPAFENLTNLDQLPSEDFEIIALPMKIKGGSGAPLRIVAIIEN